MIAKRNDNPLFVSSLLSASAVSNSAVSNSAVSNSAVSNSTQQAQPFDGLDVDGSPARVPRQPSLSLSEDLLLFTDLFFRDLLSISIRALADRIFLFLPFLSLYRNSYFCLFIFAVQILFLPRSWVGLGPGAKIGKNNDFSIEIRTSSRIRTSPWFMFSFNGGLIFAAATISAGILSAKALTVHCIE